MGRYLLQRNTQSDGWVCTDTEHQVVMTWTDGDFATTQKVTFLEDMPTATALSLAGILREMGDWLAENHRDKVGDTSAEPAWVGVVRAVRDIRIRQGLTQRDVAAALGCTYQNYQRFESLRHCPSLSFLSQVCEVLGVKVEIRGDTANWGK